MEANTYTEAFKNVCDFTALFKFTVEILVLNWKKFIVRLQYVYCNFKIDFTLNILFKHFMNYYGSHLNVKIVN